MFPKICILTFFVIIALNQIAGSVGIDQDYGGHNGGPGIPTTPPTPDVTNHTNLHLLPLETDCGSLSNYAQRIINGNKADILEFPWMALLAYQTKTGLVFKCEGTLINDRYVLTAAHCITNHNNLSLVGVRLGEHDISSKEDCQLLGSTALVICADPVQDFKIEEVIPHPNYNLNGYGNDIGLVRLSSPAQFKENVNPVCLLTSKSQRNVNLENNKLTVTGWGSSESRNRISDKLLKAEVLLIPEAECKTVYNQTSVVINYKQLCVGDKNQRSSCFNGGGPLQGLEIIGDNYDIHYVQYGIASFGIRNCKTKGFPDVYTKIGYYMDWILDNIHV